MDFETALMSGLASSSNPQAKKLKRWFDKNPKGRLRRLAMKNMQAQVDAVATNSGHYEAIDWDSLLERIGPFIQLLLKLLGIL